MKTGVDPSIQRDSLEPRGSAIRTTGLFSRRLAWAPPLLLAIALGTRLYNLGPRNTWYDEIFSMLAAEKDIPGLLAATASDVHPPLYYLLLHYWLWLGSSLTFARALSALLAVLAVMVVYLIGRRLLGAKGAVLGAVVMALNPFQLYYAQETRMYALLEASELLGIYFFIAALRGGRRRHWLFFALAETIALYSHGTAAAYLLSLDLYGLLALAALTVPAFRRVRSHVVLPAAPRRFAAGLIGANLGVTLFFWPWLGVLLSQAGKLQRGFWIPSPGLSEVVRTPIVLSFGSPPPAPWAVPLVMIVSFLMVALVLLSIVRLDAGSARTRSSLLLLLTITALPPLILLLLSLRWPMYVDKALVASGATFCLLVGWSFLTLRPRPIAKSFAGVVIALTAWCLWSYYSFDAFPRVNYPDAARYVRDHIQPGDAVVHDNKLSFFPFYYADRSLPEVFLPDPPGTPSDTLDSRTQDALGLRATSLSEATSGHERVWLIIFQQALDEAADLGHTHPNKGWLDQRYHLTQERRFSALNIYLYEPKR